jgi:hypothetical protein
MWIFKERRRHLRYSVDWKATLSCVFHGVEEVIGCRVVDVSLRGARLALEKMQAGPYHLVVGEQATSKELRLMLPDGPVKTPIEIRWYNRDDAKGVFMAGVEFVGIDSENEAIILRALNNL